MKTIKLINQEIERLEKLKETACSDYDKGFIAGEINKLIWVKDENL